MLAIIQARTNSKRFPKKVLHLINNKPLIQYVIFRVKKTAGVSKVVVATSKNKTDDELARFLKINKVDYFRGSLNNVASRFLEIAKKNKKNFFIRISGDSPLIQSKIINRAIKIHKKNKKFDLVTNLFPRTFPHGQSVEILKTSVLKNSIKKMNKSELEHVTQYFYRNYSNYLIKNFKFRGKKFFTKFAVDTKKDLNNIIKKIK